MATPCFRSSWVAKSIHVCLGLDRRRLKSRRRLLCRRRPKGMLRWPGVHPQRVRDMSTCSEQVPIGILLIWFATEIIKSTPMSRIHTKGQTQIFQRKSVARVRGARRSSTRRRQRRGCRCQRCRWRSGRCPAHGLLWRRRERVQLEVFFGA